MKQFIKDFIWFLKTSKDFTGYGYIRMILREKGLMRAIWFCKQSKFDREMEVKYGAERYYLMQDRTIEIDL